MGTHGTDHGLSLDYVLGIEKKDTFGISDLMQGKSCFDKLPTPGKQDSIGVSVRFGKDDTEGSRTVLVNMAKFREDHQVPALVLSEA